MTLLPCSASSKMRRCRSVFWRHFCTSDTLSEARVATVVLPGYDLTQRLTRLRNEGAAAAKRSPSSARLTVTQRSWRAQSD